MNELDRKLNDVFPGKVVRKDLLHKIKKGTNVPSFVLEFLLAKYCASDDAEEIKAGIEAVFETLESNYVRPDEANKAQSTVQQKGKHRFIDKIHVTYSEKEKRHWAEMENFNSRRIAIPEKFYKENDRILEGGIWAEAVVCHNDIEDDDYAFFIDDLRPIQLSRFDSDAFLAGRAKFTRDEWLDAIIRSIGLEPEKLSKRLKFHFLARFFSFVEKNYNFIELGPRGTGKSYSFSEFSPYATLISGGQATTPILFYNNQKSKVGLVGFWDTVAFDEVGSIKIKDKDSVQIMKDFMANGRFSRGVQVIADASFAFVGNIDHAIDQVINSQNLDLLYPLPDSFDLAVIDRFHYYLPGWEMPKNSSPFLTDSYGFISDYMAEAFHFLFRSQNRYDWVSRNVKLGKTVEGRDEIAIRKTICAMLKILHPAGDPMPEELAEYVEYAIEGRRRIKEQLNKRKTDEEYAKINLAFFDAAGKEQVVFCPESLGSQSTLSPERKVIDEGAVQDGNKGRTKTRALPKVQPAETGSVPAPNAEINEPCSVPGAAALKERHFRIFYGDTGFGYEAIFGDYLLGAKSIEVEDPYIRNQHQVQNFIRFCELVVKAGETEKITLITGYDDPSQKAEAQEKLNSLKESLANVNISFELKFRESIHDREIRLSTGWRIKIGRGLDIYQKPESWFVIGANDLNLRPCLETMVDIFKI
ncbi:MAG TPA: BREX system Lon protease-like protein BrxL [Spirochaetia bacterium]|nr:BREX system Lon protease-like protein BrxL [Spirochaetia bacterium]